MDRKLAIALAIVAVIVAFGAGAGTMRWMDTHKAGAGGSTAQAERGLPWPFFGHPRDANAPRAGIPKPSGFAFWRSRIDTANPDPAACAELTRPLDPGNTYADF